MCDWLSEQWSDRVVCVLVQVLSRQIWISSGDDFIEMQTTSERCQTDRRDIDVW